TQNPMCSHRMEYTRLRRATRAPVCAQKVGSSGRQSRIQRPVGRDADVGGADADDVDGGADEGVGAGGDAAGGVNGSATVLMGTSRSDGSPATLGSPRFPAV